MKRILLPILVIGSLLLTACAAPTYILSISVSPSGAGSVSPSDGQYLEGVQVTLTATPASGYTFDYWDGDASGSSATITIIIDSDKNVIANFTQITYDLTIDIVGNGTTSPPAGVHSYPSGTEVELTTTPDKGWEFSAWSGDITDTSATITIIMDSDKSIIAHFADTTPPVISEVVISWITESRAAIKWETDELATSWVEYEGSGDYGSIAALNGRLTTSHSVLLAFLKSKTTYHFRIHSVDEAGNEAVSKDYTFTTKTTKELLSASLYSGVTIGGFVHQLAFDLFNGSSQTITVTRVEFFDKNGNITHTISTADITRIWQTGDVEAGKSFSGSISFRIPYSTEEIEGWQVKWYCLDVNRVKFTVEGKYSSLR